MRGRGLQRWAVEATVGRFVGGQQLFKAGPQFLVSVAGLIEIGVSRGLGTDLPSNVKDGVFA